jgi:hypothetical protein
MSAIDQLNARSGRGTIGFGTAGDMSAKPGAFGENSFRRATTTDWNELLHV